jgi:predicted NAD/FAD-binding protein
MKIAIIGTGISGLTSGYYLHKDHDITLFEAGDYVGGHTATIDFEWQGAPYTVDTGFIVYNDRTYPRFIKMMNEIGVTGTPTEMSFSVRNDSSGLEYNGHSLSTLFAQKRNWLNPRFYSFIREILKFNKLAKASAHDEAIASETLGDFLRQHSFSDYFSENYILPMGAAIWSSTLADMRAFPLRFFLQFFLNHGLLDVKNRPQWYVVDGGSKAYIPPLTQGFKDRIKLNSPVEKVDFDDAGVTLTVSGKSERFDQVIFACHSDQALTILGDSATQNHNEVLGAMAYQANEVILHTDTSLLPKRTAAWASWNYYLDGQADEANRKPALTYDMNILQHIESEHTFCVSLNSRDRIDESKIIRTFSYDHPVFSLESRAAQQRRADIQGVNGLWFAGAYWHSGFHEDGVRSALDVVETLQQQQKQQTNNSSRGAA